MTVIALFGIATITNAQIPNYVPINGLVGWWLLDGNTNDESGNGNNGSLSNGASYTTDRNGNANSAVIFPGLLNLPVALEFTNSEWTFSFWVRKDANLGHNPIQISEMNGSQAASFGFTSLNGNLNLNNEPRIYASAGGTNCGAHGAASDCTASTGEWIHITYTYSSDLISIYKNGVLCSNFSSTSGNWPCINSNMALWIGGDVYGGVVEYFTGAIDDIGIWNRALTPQEVGNLYSGCSLEVTVQPNSQQININDNAEFMVSSSDLSASFQWQTDLGVGFQNLNSVGQYSGTTTTTLSVANVTMSNNNQPFRCIISSGSCSDTSEVAVLTVNNNVGINEFTQDYLFSVYPNPAQNVINLKADTRLIGNVYSIFDNTGRVILTGKINSENTLIELGNLPRGLYLVSVGGNRQQAFKITKSE